MLERVVDLVINMRVFIIVASVIMLIIGGGLLICCRRFSFEKKSLKTFAFFYQMKLWDTCAIAVGIAKVSLFISFFITGGKVHTVHIVTYVLLHIIYIVHKLEIKSLPSDIFMGIATCGVMSIMGVLYNYLREVIFDWRIQVVIMLMTIIVCGYALCDLYRSCGRVVRISRIEGNTDERNKEEKNI